MDDRGNLADAINELLWIHELTWKDVQDDERLQGVIIHVLINDIKYLDPSEMSAVHPKNWEVVLAEKWKRCRKPNCMPVLFNGGHWIMKLPKGKHPNQRNRGRRY